MYELPAKTAGDKQRRKRKAGAYFIGVILPSVGILLWSRKVCQPERSLGFGLELGLEWLLDMGGGEKAMNEPRTVNTFLRTVLLIVTVLLLNLSPTVVGKAQERPLSIKGLDWEKTQIFMVGMAYGVGFFNAALLMKGKSQLFCRSLYGNMVSGRELWELASKALIGPHKPGIVATAVLDELSKKYPCGR